MEWHRNPMNPPGYWYVPVHYVYPEPYETGGITKTHIDILDPKHPHICPHCQGNSARLQREGDDLYCFTCGWRDSQYFNIKFKSFLEWVVKREQEYGSPRLLSDAKQGHLNRKAEFYYNHHESELEKRKQYQNEHKEKLREYKRQWAWNKRHPILTSCQ